MTKYAKLNDTVTSLKDVPVPPEFYDRRLTGAQIIDELFGGVEMPGVMPGMSLFFTGSPGSGKSTLALQLADLYRKQGLKVLLNIGEERVERVKMVADRIGISADFDVSQFSSAERLVDYIEKAKPDFFFQDSLQTLSVGGLFNKDSVRVEAAKMLHLLAGETKSTGFIIGQVTKSGAFAGKNEIEHIFDAHAHLKVDKDSGNRIFLMHKNRIGPSGMPYELTLSAHGVELHQAPHLKEDGEEKPKSGAAERREAILTLIKEKLLEGEKISGYCFERFGADCSGGFWRVMLERASTQLKQAGHDVRKTIVNRREHVYVEPSDSTEG